MGCSQPSPVVQEAPAPTITSFSAGPAAIVAGASTTLSWTTSGAAQRHRHARHVFVNVRERLGGSESGGDHNVHPDGHKHHRLGDGDGDRYLDPAEPAHDQLVHGEPEEHHPGWDQHAQLGDIRRDDAQHCAGKPRVELRERLGQREPGDDDHLRSDGDQCRGIGDGVGHGNGDGDRWSAEDHDHKLPGRNAEHGLCGLHHCRDRRDSALQFFCRRQRQLPSTA